MCIEFFSCTVSRYQIKMCGIKLEFKLRPLNLVLYFISWPPIVSHMFSMDCNYSNAGHLCRVCNSLSSKSLVYQLIPAIGVIALAWGLLPLMRLGWSIFLHVLRQPFHWNFLYSWLLFQFNNFSFLTSFLFPPEKWRQLEKEQHVLFCHLICSTIAIMDWSTAYLQVKKSLQHVYQQ